MRLKRTLAATIAGFMALGGAASAHTVGIGDSVSGSTATIYLAHWHGSSAALHGGILMTSGPLSGNGYAFDTNLGGTSPLGAADWDTGLTSGASGYFSRTLTGLYNGTYSYRLDTSIQTGTNATTTPSTGPGNGSFFTGSFTVTNGLVPNMSAVPLPAAGWMLLAGVGGLVGLRRRKKA